MAFQPESDHLKTRKIPAITDFSSFKRRIVERIEGFYGAGFDEIPYDEVSLERAITQVLEERPESRVYLYQDELLVDLDIDDVTFCRLLYTIGRNQYVTIEQCVADGEMPFEKWFEQIVAEHKGKEEVVNDYLVSKTTRPRGYTSVAAEMAANPDSEYWLLPAKMAWTDRELRWLKAKLNPRHQTKGAVPEWLRTGRQKKQSSDQPPASDDSDSPNKIHVKTGSWLEGVPMDYSSPKSGGGSKAEPTKKTKKPKPSQNNDTD